MKRSGQGFTLVELIVVIALIGILAAVAMPSFNAWRKQASRREVANEVAGALMKARTRAISRNEKVVVVFNIDGSAGNQNNSYTLKLFGGPDIETKQLAAGIEIRGKADCTKTSDTMEIRFNPDGTAYYGGINGGSYICIYNEQGAVSHSAGVASTSTGRVVTKRGAP